MSTFIWEAASSNTNIPTMLQQEIISSFPLIAIQPQRRVPHGFDWIRLKCIRVNLYDDALPQNSLWEWKRRKKLLSLSG